ncbi:MAG: NAD-dependent epimerase/dehydratase family protein, partial [Proteobacteria bacterium]|nr:NAD-dependent epimerase/dehydratase family protein [Pseudomonadota bacterium]
MKVFMTGGTGFVGTTLTRNLVEQGHQVTVLTRKIPVNDTLPHGVSLLEGDPTRRGEWQRRVPQHDIIVNLAGASIFMRWDKKGKAVIRESRVSTTTNLIEALSDGMKNETTFISTSAVGYYGFHGDETLEEDSP